MPYSSLEHFKEDIRQSDPLDLVIRWLNTALPHAFASSSDLKEFTLTVSNDYPAAQSVRIAGTANWKYSLNPKKSFSTFHAKSDIDVVVVSYEDFSRTWEEMRLLHRKKWYAWGKNLRESIQRLGQDVYCGFVSPKRHIPDKSNSFRFHFLRRCNAYSTSLVGYRDVNLMFFKCEEDAIDYYIRGVRRARSSV